MKLQSGRRRLVLGVSGAVALGVVSLGVAQAYYASDDDQPVDAQKNRQNSVQPTDTDLPDPLPTTLPEVDVQHDKVDTRPATMAEAQALYDPESDPYTLVGKDPDGSFYMLSVAMAGPPPKWVTSVEDLQTWQAQVAPQSEVAPR